MRMRVLVFFAEWSAESIVHTQPSHLPSSMGILFRAKRGGALPSAFFFATFLTFLSILGSAFLSIGIGNPVNKVTNALLASNTFKRDAGTYFVTKALETASGEERSILIKKGPQISATVTAFLGNPIFKGELNAASNIAYRYYTGGSKVRQSINVKPILQLALLGFESVDPQFVKLKKELDKIKPIKLQPQTSGPDASQIKSYFTLGIWLLLLLSLLSLVLYLFFANSLKSALRKIGTITFSNGIMLIVMNLAVSAVVKNQARSATESLVQLAIPIAAHPLLSPLMNVGVIELLLGLLLFLLSYLKRMNVDSQS